MDRDPFNLERFVTAQSATFDIALAELQAGQKQTHWMWFIFPQLRGLGLSGRARSYGVTDLEEARAYLTHPVLAPRLEQATQAVLVSDAPSLRQIFGSPDDLKFHSSMTLFAVASSLKDSLSVLPSITGSRAGWMLAPWQSLANPKGASPRHPSGKAASTEA